MEITRDVILDLLPLYIANEVSEDTRALIEKYLENDPEIAKIALKSAMAELPRNIPSPLTKEDKMKAYGEAKRLMFLRTMILAVLISGMILALLAAFFLFSSY
jgi:hypothetical protein